jgi:hypothetical protein
VKRLLYIFAKSEDVFSVIDTLFDKIDAKLGSTGQAHPQEGGPYEGEPDGSRRRDRGGLNVKEDMGKPTATAL